jgi:hypothetical protein
MQDSKTPFYCSEFPWARAVVPPKIINFLVRAVKKVRQPFICCAFHISPSVLPDPSIIFVYYFSAKMESEIF